LAEIRAFNQTEALKTLDIINTVHKEMTERYGDGFVYPSDEFFLLADVPIPDVSYYNGFPQIENGVGMMADFRASLESASENYNNRNDHDRTVSDDHRIGLITGRAAHAFMTTLINDLKKVMPDLDVIIYPIKNDYFGEKITVSGLITGKDIIEQVKPELLENSRDLLLIPENALRCDTQLLLDDWTLEMLSEHLGVKIVGVPIDGESLIEIIRN
jgi:NifB/MoaA-like Fe-S oxidoreductase